MKFINRDQKLRRKKRVSSNIKGIASRPRIAVFRSNKYIYAQAIDDKKKSTIVSFSSLLLKNNQEMKKIRKTEKAFLVGKKLGEILLEKAIKEGVFDRSIYPYKGQVKALAEGLRKAGLKI